MSNNLETLYSDRTALQQQLDDVDDRMETARSELEAEIAEVRMEWEAKYTELLAEHQAIDSAFSAKDKELRAAMIAAYEENPASKVLAPGLSIRVSTSLRYDPEKAIEWAKAHNLALALDKKAFEAIAKVQSIDFVVPVDSITTVVK